MPPMRFGMKNTVRNRLVPRSPRVSSSASAKANRLTVTTDTTVNSAVKPSARTKSPPGSVNTLR